MRMNFTEMVLLLIVNSLSLSVLECLEPFNLYIYGIFIHVQQEGDGYCGSEFLRINLFVNDL